MNLRQYPFSDVFQENADGSLNPKRTISISGVTLGPEVKFGPGMVVGGIDFHKYKYRPVAAEERDNTLVIRGFYKE